MLMILIYFTLISGTLVASEICSVCKCVFADVRRVDADLAEDVEIMTFKYKMETLESYNSNVTYKSVKKYFHVDCSSDSNVGQMNNLEWPKLDVLGIIGNFRRSKWKKLEFFPDHIKGQIVVLSLSENKISEIEPNELDDFQNLKMLNVTGNQMEIVKKHSFAKLNNLKMLDLSNNIITQIEDWAFYETQLKYLNLSGNLLTYLTPDSLQGLGNVLMLDVSDNNLIKLPENFAIRLKSLTFLSLNGNSFTNLPELPKDLKKVYVRRNQLDELRLSHSQLQILDVGSNNIASLANLHTPALKVIKADNNNLTNLLQLNSKGIVIMDLSNNKFTAVPQDITVDRFYFLERLYMDGNFITNASFPFQPEPFQNLRTLSFSKCSLEVLSKTMFSGVFPRNKIDCFRSHGISLDFSHNFINQIDYDALQNYPICSIDLSNNKLRTISESFVPWKKMSHVNLQKNPWHCDCSIQWMLDNYMTFMYKNYPKYLHELRCETPLRYNSKMFVFWYNKTDDVFCKSGPSSLYFDVINGRTIEVWTASAVACVVLACIIVLLALAITILLCMKPQKRRRQPKKINQVTNNYKPVLQNPKE
ncbi:hypothetical protein RUM43_001239 [Polyplax serrata]|uniref:Uncharacterized protein n=1 Tax=Polyplax serrata TaxID=468196 RepID=A0AAN8XPE4_POLSC